MSYIRLSGPRTFGHAGSECRTELEKKATEQKILQFTSPVVYSVPTVPSMALS